MRLLISDLYKKCDDLIKDANILYNILYIFLNNIIFYAFEDAFKMVFIQ